MKVGGFRYSGYTGPGLATILSAGGWTFTPGAPATLVPTYAGSLVVRPNVTNTDLGSDTRRWDLFSGEVWGGQVVEVLGGVTYPLTTGDYEVHCNTAAGSVVITLPASATNAKRRFLILKTTTDANTVTINPPGGSTVGTAASVTLAGGAVRAVGVTGPVTGLDWKVW